jgi:hypothetical protein
MLAEFRPFKFPFHTCAFWGLTVIGRYCFILNRGIVNRKRNQISTVLTISDERRSEKYYVRGLQITQPSNHGHWCPVTVIYLFQIHIKC